MKHAERIHIIGKAHLIAAACWFLISAAIMLYTIGPKAIFTHDVSVIALRPDMMTMLSICLMTTFANSVICAVCFYIACRAVGNESSHENQLT